MRNYSVSQIFSQKYFIVKQIYEFRQFAYRCIRTTTAYAIINQVSKNCQ